MRGAMFYGRHDLRLEDCPMPEVGEEEVLIEVKACGVCGTDVHIYEGDEGAAQVMPPTILGHEFAGVVVAVGDKVRGFRKGDRVCIDPNYYCGSCEFCRNGVAHYCTRMTGYGTTVNGGFAQYCSVNERQVYHLGDHTSFEEGAMAEPVACCLHGIDMCNICPGQHVLVFGGGMIGLLMVQLARLEGAARVILAEPVESKRKIGEKLGADITVDPFAKDMEKVLQEKGIHQIDVVIECVGKPETIEQAIKVAGKKSVVMMFGLTKPDEAISVRPFEIFQKEIELKSSYINPYTQGRALELIDSGRLDVSSMVCEICGLDKLDAILSDPVLRAKGKYIIAP